MKITITEALQEIKTINKRLESKRRNILSYVGRDNRVKDPLEKEGGTVEFIKKERQALSDLEKRIISIRTAIQRSNLQTSKEGRVVVPLVNEATSNPGDVVVHLEEKAILEEQEKHDVVVGDLDGRLSLLNATTVIEFE